MFYYKVPVFNALPEIVAIAIAIFVANHLVLPRCSRMYMIVILVLNSAILVVKIIVIAAYTAAFSYEYTLAILRNELTTRLVFDQSLWLEMNNWRNLFIYFVKYKVKYLHCIMCIKLPNLVMFYA